MSTPKTLDDTTSPEPVVSPRRKLKRQGAEDRKMVAWTRQRKMIARALLKKLNEDNCERYGGSKVEIFRLREAAYGPR
jgi:hypothetical protein